LHDILSKEAQDILRNYLQVRHHRHLFWAFFISMPSSTMISNMW
jgi:hypothetical protein